MKYIIDSHCHIQFPIYDNDREAVIERARKSGIKMIAGGTQISTSEAAINLSWKYPDDIWATVGYHPSHATHALTYADDNNRGLTRTTGWYHDPKEQKENAPEKFDIKKLRELAGNPKVVGIGECGLDYYYLRSRTDADGTLTNAENIKKSQKEVFMEMAGLASELKKPLVIHCRPSYVKTSADAKALADESEGKAINGDDAYLDLLEMLESRNDIEFKVLHCFLGDLEITKKMLEAGFYFTLGGVITFPDKKDKNKGAYDEIIRYIPLDRIMAETDSPYIAPVPYRGKRNEPLFVVEVIRKLAEIKNIPLDSLAEKISGTVNKIFKI